MTDTIVDEVLNDLIENVNDQFLTNGFDTGKGHDGAKDIVVSVAEVNGHILEAKERLKEEWIRVLAARDNSAKDWKDRFMSLRAKHISIVEAEREKIINAFMEGPCRSRKRPDGLRPYEVYYYFFLGRYKTGRMDGVGDVQMLLGCLDYLEFVV